MEEEIANFAPQQLSENWRSSLNKLVNSRIVFFSENFYSLHISSAMIKRRVIGNARARLKMNLAKKYSNVIASFPFVRGVMLSGSISKNFMDKDSDIDYFIITEKGRLWTVRTLLVLFRRLILFNSRDCFCTNYFIDTEHLKIEEKNIFTAIEVATLKPMYGQKITSEFHQANRWIEDILPNKTIVNSLDKDKRIFGKRWLERFLSIRLFNYLEHLLMILSICFLRKRYSSFLSKSDFKIAFQSTPFVSRSHPNFFQKRVLATYQEKINHIKNDLELNKGYLW
ncbi:MAG: hypothetical protein JST37_01095 [Bacteroidetes bacterium]|jgi:predicted nucleotidyltransferase|nr:hypothetical protein [Bacteroidota bacterium]